MGKPTKNTPPVDQPPAEEVPKVEAASVAPENSGPIKVRALPVEGQQFYSGFYGSERRRPGDVFMIVNEKAFAGDYVNASGQTIKGWMVKVPPETDLTGKAGPTGLTMVDRDAILNEVEAAKQQARAQARQEVLDEAKAQSEAGYVPPSRGQAKPASDSRDPDLDVI